jgi:hypothetical protein
MGGASNLILGGWKLVSSGPVSFGDKFWSSKHQAWLPITVNDFRNVSEIDAVIRRGQ